MLAYAPEPLAVGSKTARMEQRTTPEAKHLIESAASLLGVNSSEFTVMAATAYARQTIMDYQSTTLKLEARDAFMAAFEAEEPTSELVDLMALHADVAARR